MAQPIEKLTLRLLRETLQGGIPNERYPVDHLYDVRKSHHIITDAVQQWKGYRCAGNDAKFTDIVCIADPTLLAEGKTVNKSKGVCLKPSVDCGGGRKFNPENLTKCLEKNSFYFFYQIVSHTETTLTIEVYWVPIATVKQWYTAYGNKGVLGIKAFRTCLKDCRFVETVEDRTKKLNS